MQSEGVSQLQSGTFRLACAHAHVSARALNNKLSKLSRLQEA